MDAREGTLTAVALGIALLAGGCAYTARVSVATNGTQGDGASTGQAVSDDGRLVAFGSQATNLLPPGVDTNGAGDVFVRDLATGTTTRVSVASGGAEAGGGGAPAMSDDGRYVAFSSSAANLVAGDTNGQLDVFVHDRNTSLTTRVSVATGGTQGNGTSWRAEISGDGRYVTFDSTATNLVPGDTNNAGDVFVHDRTTGVTERVSLNSSEQQAGTGCWSGWPSISDDGRYVAFESSPCAWGLPGLTVGAHIWLRDRTAGTTQIIAGGSAPGIVKTHTAPAMSGDGRFVLFVSSDATIAPGGDTNNASDVFVYDRLFASYERVSVGSGGIQGNLSAGSPASISDDGRWVAFSSDATNLVPGDTNGTHDVFVRDRATDRTFRASTDILLAQANGPSIDAHISGDGKYVTYWSAASNLVAGDTNGEEDVFVQAANRPDVDFITPGAVVVGFSGPVMIAGVGFEAGADVRANTDKISFTNVVVVDDETITATMTVASDAARQGYDVIVANPGGAWQPVYGAAGMCPGCLLLR